MPRQPKALLTQAIGRLLHPAVKFCLRRGMRVQELIELLKTACINVASEEMTARGEEINVSRLSVLTGVQRRDVKRLMSSAPKLESGANLLARVLGQWQSDPRFCDKAGNPRVLSAEGAESEFAALVKSVSVDVNPYTILFGLEQSDSLRREGKKVRLVAEALDISDAGEGIALLAQDSAALHDAVSENLFSPEETPNLHLTTEFNNICAENIPAIRAWLLDRGTAFHEEARAHLAKFDKDLNPRLHAKEGGGSVSLSAFSVTRKKNL